MIRVSLDFPDDIRPILKRILMMRKDLKKAKNMSEGYNSRSIFAGANYKQYDNQPQTNRPGYMKTEDISDKNKLNNQERRLSSIV